MTLDTTNIEQQNALQIIQYTRRSLFLTGKAGTGKSTLLRYIDKNIKKKHIVLAPTGIAAINAGGSTLHSFFKLPFHPLLPNDSRFNARNIRETLKYSNEKRKLLQEIELIIIDEISMVRADIIDFIDKVLRIYCRNMREPFGGKQLLLVGDVYQLEPVVKEEDRQMLQPFYPNSFFFNAHVFREMKLVSIELKKVYRQNDPRFISLLDNIRKSTITDGDLYRLNQRVGCEIQEEGLSITLSSRRDTVDFINQQKLDELQGESRVFEGLIKGEFPESSLPTPIELELKLGAQVLFVRNDKEHRWVNGTLGIVSAFTENEEGVPVISVQTDDGYEVDVEQEIWSNVRYTFNEQEKKVEEEELGTYQQFPLRLAWAITIHKSQGLTFRHVKIDFTGGIFAAGQTYVALSRCTSLEGISLHDPIKRSDIFVRPEVQEFATHYNDSRLIDVALKQSQADQKYHEAARAFDEGDMQACLDAFFIAIHSRYDIEKPSAKRLIRRKLNTISRLKAEKQAVEERLTAEKQAVEDKLTALNEKLKTLSTEYVILGKECETEGMTAAAIRNYEKALELYPEHPDAKRRLKKLRK